MQLMQHLIEQMLKIRCKSHFRNSLFAELKPIFLAMNPVSQKYKSVVNSFDRIQPPKLGFLIFFLYISKN